MEVKKLTDNVEILTPLIATWQKEYALDDFGIIFDLTTALRDLQNLVEGDQSTLLVLMDAERPVGFMGLQSFDSPLGGQRIANEHYFYVLPQFRGTAAVRMIKASKNWAKENNCSHLILNASRAASSLYERVCSFYERLNFQEFEKSFISKV